MTSNNHLKEEFIKKWQTWLPKLQVGVQAHITATHLKKLDPLVKDITDFDDDNCKIVVQ